MPNGGGDVATDAFSLTPVHALPVPDAVLVNQPAPPAPVPVPILPHDTRQLASLLLDLVVTPAVPAVGETVYNPPSTGGTGIDATREKVVRERAQ